LPKRSRERTAKLQKLISQGNFRHNISVIKKGTGEIVVARRSASKTPADYTACEFCKTFHMKKNLWKHMKSCVVRREYYGSSNVECEKRIAAVRRGKSLIVNAAFTSEDGLVNELFVRMRDDDIKQVVISDELLCREAGLRMAALGSKRDQKQDDVYRVSQAVRTLGRVLQLARETVPDATMYTLIHYSATAL